MKKIILSVIALVGLANTLFGLFDLEYAPFSPLVLFPYQIGLSDFICTGTVTTTATNSADIAVDEVLWGHSTSSNITVRCIFELDVPMFIRNEKYLVFAFTNNWWSGCDVDTCPDFAHFLSPTNHPVNHAVFDDFRIMNFEHSAVNFNIFNVNGTNYWPDTRSFITNFLDIARIQHNEEKAIQQINEILAHNTNTIVLPSVLIRDLKKYDLHYYLMNRNEDSN